VHYMANKVILYIKMQFFKKKSGNVLKLFSNKILGEKKKKQITVFEKSSPTQIQKNKTIAGAEEEQHIGVVISRLLYI
jgi:hypothetical protein